MFIELMAWWTGSVSNKQLVHQFDISRQQAFNDLKAYCKQHPKNLVQLDTKYYPSQTFQFSNISGHVEQFLLWMASGQLLQENTSKHVTRLPMPERNISVKIIRALYQAITENKRLETSYVSLSNPEHDGRIFHPLIFVNTGLRYHVRGYCEKSQDFRDLVLSRFGEEIEVLDSSPYRLIDDTNWQTEIDIVLRPDSRLTPEQQQVLVSEYQLTDGELVIQCKAALANYLLNSMNINTKMLDGNPTAQQWVLVNLNDIKQWLY